MRAVLCKVVWQILLRRVLFLLQPPRLANAMRFDALAEILHSEAESLGFVARDRIVS